MTTTEHDTSRASIQSACMRLIIALPENKDRNLLKPFSCSLKEKALPSAYQTMCEPTGQLGLAAMRRSNC